MPAEDNLPVVVAAVRQGLGKPDVAVEHGRILSGGAMHEWWAADAPGADPAALVVRLSPPTRDDAAKTRLEYAVLQAVRKRGVRVARPVFAGENERGQTFLLSERVDGDTNPKQLTTSPGFDDTRRALIDGLAHDLAAIHRVHQPDVAAPLRGPAAGQDPLLFEVDRQWAEYEKVKLNPHPLLEWALRWIARQATELQPRQVEPHVVHGDFRIGNILYDAEGLAAILDWEGVHLGEPEDDLAWFCTKVWRFNRRDREAGGIASRDEWVRLYEEYSGTAVDRRRLTLWEILGNVRWAIICMMQARQHLDGVMNSQEHAAIGRRTGDTELEVLRLVREWS